MGLNVNNNLVVPQQYARKQNQQNNSQQTSFGNVGAITNVISNIDKNDLLNYSLLDFVSMIGPRTYIDASRNPYAGMETFARESFGAVSMCITPGFLALGLAALAGKINNPTGVKTTLFARPAMIDHLYEDIWKKIQNKSGDEKVAEYVKNALDGLHVNIGNKAQGGSQVKKLADAADNVFQSNDIIKKLQKLIVEKDQKLIKHLKAEVADELADAVGTRGGFSINNIRTNADDFVRDVVDIGRHVLHKYDAGNFSKEAIEGLAKKNINNKEVALERAVGRLKMVSNFKTAATFAVIGGICFSFQFINKAITKARTGQSGFVGYSDFGGEDKKAKGSNKNQKAEKEVKNDIKQKEAKTGKKQELSFKGFIDPTISGPYAGVGFFRGVYPLTILGRLAASRDKNETRETIVRDTLGYMNWLVLGPVAAKIIGEKLSNGLMIKGTSTEGFFNKIGNFFKSGLMSFDDLSALVNNLSRKSLDELKEAAGKVNISSISSNEINNFKGLSGRAKAQLRLPEGANKEIQIYAEKLYNKLDNIRLASWIGGFAWSTIMLGILLPKFNAWMTEKNRKAERNANEQAQNKPIEQLQEKAKPQQVNTVQNVQLNDAMNKFMKRQSLAS